MSQRKRLIRSKVVAHEGSVPNGESKDKEPPTQETKEKKTKTDLLEGASGGRSKGWYETVQKVEVRGKVEVEVEVR
jgi:hypothetical protein